MTNTQPQAAQVLNFTKKPVTIQAAQWFKHGDHPAVTSIPVGHPIDRNCIDPSTFGWVPTLESGHVVTPGDWIITGIKGEHYPCKPDIFAATYEPAKLQAATPAGPVKPDSFKWRRRARDEWQLAKYIPISDDEITEMRARGWDVVELFDRPATPASEGQLREAPLVGRDTRDTVTITLRTEPMADGSWCAHMIVMGLHSEQMANAAMDHMQNLFCGQEIKNSD